MNEVWRRDLHQAPNARSKVSPKLVIVPERRNYLVRLDPSSGSMLWEVRTANTWGWLAHDERRVFWLNQHNLVQCHDLETGEAQWTAERPDIWGWLVPAGDVLVLGGWRGYAPLVALDVTTGERRWRFDLDGRRIAEPIVGPWGIAVALLDEPRLLFLDAHGGSTIAEVPLPPHEQDPDASALIRCSDERLTLAGRDGRYYMMEPPWRAWRTLFAHPQTIETTAPVVFDDFVVFMDGTGQLCCYGLAAGDLRWKTTWHHRRRDFLPAALSAKRLLALGSASGRLAVFGVDGEVIWSKVVAKRIQTEMAWLDERTVLAGTTGTLVAFRPRLP